MANVLLCPADKKKKFVWIELNRPLSFDRSGVTWPPLRRFHWAKNVRLVFLLEHFVHFEFEFFFTRSWPSMKTRKILGIFVKKLTNPTRDTGTRRHWNTHGTHSLEHFQILLGKIFFFWDVRRSLTRGDGDTASAPTHRQLADQVSPLAAS